MRTTSMPTGKAMYVASEPDRAWLRSKRRELYARSQEVPGYIFCKLWGLVTDLHNLRSAFVLVAANKGRRTPGVDGVTVGAILHSGIDPWLMELRAELRTGSYRPAPVRRVLIPKQGQPGKFRPLGIPTVKDRVVQAALKNILEPIFESGFYPCSYGFRPRRSVHGALAHLKVLLRPTKIDKGGNSRLPYTWALEGDIQGCFDNINHHGLMERFRRRVRDPKVNRLVVAFLKAGVLAEEGFMRSEAGTPQGGILSPLLANIALSVIEERYERHAWPSFKPTPLTAPHAIEQRAMAARRYDRTQGRVVMYPIRYADDFIILVGASTGPGGEDPAQEAAVAEKVALAAHLEQELGLKLSETKTLVTPVTRPMRFLGHHVQVKWDPGRGKRMSKVLLPRERSGRLRQRVKDLFRNCTRNRSLDNRLRRLNTILRGWGNFYRHANGVGRALAVLDHYIWWTIFRWLRKKHPRIGARELKKRYGKPRPGLRSWDWGGMGIRLFRLSSIARSPYLLGWQRPPDFAKHPGEPGA